MFLECMIHCMAIIGRPPSLSRLVSCNVTFPILTRDLFKSDKLSEDTWEIGVSVKLLCYIVVVTWLLKNTSLLGFFSLRHFGHLSHSCIKLVITVFASLYFQTFWPKWLNFFAHFKNVLVCDRKKTASAYIWNNGFRKLIFWKMRTAFPNLILT